MDAAYLPLFAQPTKINELVPAWSASRCIADVPWNGWDPARTLAPAAAMAPASMDRNAASTRTTSTAPSSTIPALPVDTTSVTPTTGTHTDSPGTPQDEPRQSQESSYPMSGKSSTKPPPALVPPSPQESTATKASSILLEQPKLSITTPSKEAPISWSDDQSSSPIPMVSSSRFDGGYVPPESESQPATLPQEHQTSIEIVATDGADNTTLSTKPPRDSNIGPTTYTAKQSGFLVGNATLLPGNEAITIAGMPISLASSHFVVGASAISFDTAAQFHPTSIMPNGLLPTFSIARYIYTAAPTGFSIKGTTLFRNRLPVTISGIPLSLGPPYAIAGSSTINIPSVTTALSLRINEATLPDASIAMGSETITLEPSAVVIAGSTLTLDAPAVVANGITVSLASYMLVVESETETFATAQIKNKDTADSSGNNIGALIMSVFGQAPDVETVAMPSQTSLSINGSLSFYDSGFQLQPWPLKSRLAATLASLCMHLIVF